MRINNIERISDLILRLQKIQKLHGDIYVLLLNEDGLIEDGTLELHPEKIDDNWHDIIKDIPLLISEKYVIEV